MAVAVLPPVPEDEPDCASNQCEPTERQTEKPFATGHDPNKCWVGSSGLDLRQWLRATQNGPGAGNARAANLGGLPPAWGLGHEPKAMSRRGKGSEGSLGQDQMEAGDARAVTAVWQLKRRG